MPLSPDDLNATITGWAAAAQLSPAPVATMEDLIEFSNQMPLFENKEDREAINAQPSLVGAWPKLFLMIEDAFHKAKEEGTKEEADVDQIIRIQSQEIAAAIFTYVNNAIVHTMVNTTTTGAGTIMTVSTTSTIGAGTGKGLGKLA